MADKTDSVAPSQPGEMNLTANHNGRPPKPKPPPKPQHLRKNGEKAVRPRSSVIPVNKNGSSMGALAGSQMQLAWLNSVLSNSHLAVDPSIQELLMNAGVSSTTTVFSSSLFILKVIISTTDDILQRIDGWETEVKLAIQMNGLRTWTLLTSTTSVTIQTTADTGTDPPPEAASVDIFCNRPSGVGRNAVATVCKALIGSADDSNEPSIFSMADVPTENVNVVVTYSD